MTEPLANPISVNPDRSIAWRQPNIGPSWQQRVFGWILRRRGKRRAYQISRLATLWYVAFYPSIRRRCRYYLDRRFPDRRGLFQRLADVYRVVRSFAATLVDMVAMNVLGPEALAATCPDHDRLMELAGSGRGLILLFAHVGCWQVGMSTLRQFERQVSVVMIPEPRTTAMFDARSVSVIDPRTGLESVMAMTQALLRGDIVAMMGDRTFGDEQNEVPVTFLGGTVKLPMIAYRLASATGAPVVLMMAPKNNQDAYELRLAKLIEVPSGIGREASRYAVYAQQFADCLDQFVRENPWQFYNFYDLWTGD